jgi:hypothetical protein
MLGQGAGAFHFQDEGRHGDGSAGQVRLQQKARLAAVKAHNIHVIACDGIAFGWISAAGFVNVIAMGWILVGDGRVARIDLLSGRRLPLIGSIVRSSVAAHDPFSLWQRTGSNPQPFPIQMMLFRKIAP